MILAALPLLGGWVWNTERRLTKHDGVIDKLDQLVTLLLEDRIHAQSKEGSHSQEFGDRSRRD